MNRRVLIAGIAVTVPLLAVLWANIGRDPHRVRSPLVGRAAPAFSLTDVESGEVISLAQLAGRPVVLNFWATWCVPCYAEHRVLVEGAKRSPEVAFIGVVYDDERDRILQFLAENGSGYPSVIDVGGRTAIAYGVYGVPETFFINPSGVITAKHEGPLDPRLLAGYLSRTRG